MPFAPHSAFSSALFLPRFKWLFFSDIMGFHVYCVSDLQIFVLGLLERRFLPLECNSENWIGKIKLGFLSSSTWLKFLLAKLYPTPSKGLYCCASLTEMFTKLQVTRWNRIQLAISAEQTGFKSRNICHCSKQKWLNTYKRKHTYKINVQLLKQSLFRI